jgi:predicted ester cyclase
MKTAILLLAGAAFAVCACGNNASVKGMHDSSGTSMQASSSNNSAEAKEERNKNVALQSVEGINKHDAMMAMKDVTTDAVDYGDGSQKPVKSKDSVVGMVNAWMKAFPDVKGENLKAIADGDWVVVWGDWSGTWKGDFMGQKATGKSYKIKDVDIFRLNDEGKITEHHSVPTWYAIAEQVGMKTK